MPHPSVYLDECVSKRLVIRMRWRGFHVTTAGEVGLLEASDDRQFSYAAQHSLLLITHNRRHFIALHNQYMRGERTHHGLLVLPFTPVQILDIRVAICLDWISAIPDHRSMLFRWNDFQQRLIWGDRIPDSSYTEEEVWRALGHPA